MSVTPDNLVQGPATLYSGSYSLTGVGEPTDATVNATPAVSSWTDIGGTMDGLKITVDQSFSELEVDQLVDVVGSRIQKRVFTLETSCAEPTLANLAMATNTTAGASGAGYTGTWDPTTDTSATQPAYFAILADGWAPNYKRRRVIGRKVLVTEKVEMAYLKDKQTVIPTTFKCHYVSAARTPIHVVDAA